MNKNIVILSDEQLKKVQSLELLALQEVNRICTKYNIKYTLGYGTLIGAVRHKGFIPWDDDIDICMLRKDYIRFKEICKKELSSGYFYQDNESDPEYYMLYDKIRVDGTLFKEAFQSQWNIHHGIYVDIFPIDAIPDQKWKETFQYLLFHFFRTGVMVKYGNIASRTGKKKVFAKILRVLYMPFSLSYLYKNANRVAMKYDDIETKRIHSFCGPYKKKDIFERKIYSQMEVVPFENMEAQILKDYDIVLKSIYGDYMKLPPKEKRVTRHSLVQIDVE
ncbi:MAG: LicD family protein [Bacillota bacterium]|nr:LicD family protein [Bacillota bacterium]